VHRQMIIVSSVGNEAAVRNRVVDGSGLSNLRFVLYCALNM
jgi:hypothetical protein